MAKSFALIIEKIVENHLSGVRKRWLWWPWAGTNIVRSLASAVPADDLGGGGRRNRTCGSISSL